jgi:hypothetical protein
MRVLQRITDSEETAENTQQNHTLIKAMSTLEIVEQLPIATDKPTKEQIKAAKIQALRQSLDGFTGTEDYHRLTMYRWLLATDGVAHLCKEGACYWLMDLIGSHIATKPAIREDSLTIWWLRLLPPTAKNAAEVYCQSDTDTPKLCSQLIPYTDFPLAEGIKLYISRTEHDGRPAFVVMLPSEY